MNQRSSLDQFELKILAILQEDASRSNAEIAAEIGLSEAPCWRRVQRLKKEGYIRSQVCLLDRKKVGLKIQVFAQVRLSAVGKSNLVEFEDAMREFPEVLDCFVIMGNVDFLLRIVTRDIESYERFFFEKLSQVPGVEDVHSMVAMSEVKSTTSLGTRDLSGDVRKRPASIWFSSIFSVRIAE